MENHFSYLILGAGKQGVAAAYDILRFGQTKRCVIADNQLSFAKKAVQKLQKLLNPYLKKEKISLSAIKVSGNSKPDLKKKMKNMDGVLSALPYYLNPTVAECAIATKTHFVDLGGHFETTQKILKAEKKAKKAGVTIITDCGVSPGMCNSLAAFGIEQFDSAQDIHIYCGGLPQQPSNSLGYHLVFNLEGVLGNYFGKAYELRNGKIQIVSSFSGLEKRFFPNIGQLEAVVTGGATATCPWSYLGKIRTYNYKTLRYPGHFEKFRAMKELGLFETTPIQVNGKKVVPIDVFVAAAKPHLTSDDPRDILILQVIVRGEKNGKVMQITYDVLDYYDPKTQFTAMQRTTGFSAAIVLEMIVSGIIRKRGVIPVEKGVPAKRYVQEIEKRGIHVKETIQSLETPGGQ